MSGIFGAVIERAFATHDLVVAYRTINAMTKPHYRRHEYFLVPGTTMRRKSGAAAIGVIPIGAYALFRDKYRWIPNALPDEKMKSTLTRERIGPSFLTLKGS